MTSRKSPQYFAAFAASGGGGFATGTIIAWIFCASTFIYESSENDFDIFWNGLDFIISSIAFGATLGCTFIGLIINFIGTKVSMIISTIPFTLGWALIFFTTNIWIIFTGQTLLGFAIGILWVSTPIYVGEIAQKDIRGSIASLFQLMITVGILFVFILASRITLATLVIVCAVIPLIYGVTIFFIPETPRFLVSKGRTDDAIKSLQKLRGKKYDYKPELNFLELTNKEANETAMTNSQILKSFMISFSLTIFQQLSGNNGIILYAYLVFVFAQTKVPFSDFSTSIALLQVIATICSVFLVDRLGRRKLLLISQTLMVLSSFILGGFFYFRETGISVTNYGWIAKASISFFILSFSLGMGTVPFVINSEIFPIQLKGAAISFTGLVNWLLVFAIIKSIAFVIGVLSNFGTFWLFSVITALGSIFVFFCLPETNGKSLRKIQDVLEEGENDYYI